MAKALWLFPAGQIEGRTRCVFRKCKTLGRSVHDIHMMQMSRVINDVYWIRKPKTKGMYYVKPGTEDTVKSALRATIKQYNPNVIVINCIGIGHILFPEEFKNQKLETYRGSVYDFEGTPCLVIDELSKSYMPEDIMPDKYKYDFILEQHMQKLFRYIDGTQYIAPDINYEKLDTVKGVQDFLKSLDNGMLMASDIETAQGLITCIGFSVMYNNGTIYTCTIPLYAPFYEDGLPYDVHVFDAIWKLVTKILAHPIPKTFHNGSYDCAYLLRYNMPPNNYYLDSLHLLHSLYPELPKTLAFTASLMCDNYTYWKEEIKGDSSSATKAKVPITQLGYDIYLNYCGKDCYYTLISTLLLLPIIGQEDWSMTNYRKEIRIELGPAFYMSMRGMAVNKDRQKFYMNQLQKETDAALIDLRTATADPEFNPQSADQVSHLFYDILGCKPVDKNKPRSADKKMLKLLAEKSSIAAIFTKWINAAKEPANNLAKYGTGLVFYRNRFMYQLSVLGTWTSRFNGKQHQFWVGTNPQNIPGDMREFLVADPGCVLCDADFAQSDAYFVAFESQDTNMIETMLDDQDVHCKHAAFFFGEDYDKVYADHKKKGEWTNHPITGIRQITKKVTHGCNYLMGGYTMLLNVGKLATAAAGEKLGMQAGTSDKELITITQFLIKRYFERYSGVTKFLDNMTKLCAKQNNLITNAFGRTHRFFGDPASSHKIKRNMASFFGQGGTAGNINRALEDLYFDKRFEYFWDNGGALVLQVHDSIVTQFPENNVHPCVEALLTAMQQPVIINEREFHVPSSAEISRTWTKKPIDYDASSSVEDIIAALNKHETELDKKYVLN